MEPRTILTCAILNYCLFGTDSWHLRRLFVNSLVRVLDDFMWERIQSSGRGGASKSADQNEDVLHLGSEAINRESSILAHLHASIGRLLPVLKHSETYREHMSRGRRFWKLYSSPHDPDYPSVRVKCLIRAQVQSSPAAH